MSNSLIIIATRKVLRWHRLRRCMAESVGHHCFGIRQGKSSLWTISFATSRETGTNNKAKLEGCIVSTEKLCRHEKKRFGV